MVEELARIRRVPMRGRGLHGQHRALGLVGLVVAALATLLTSCYPGIYVADVFPEMHYQPSHRPYEPPRPDTPASAVPITGLAVVPATMEAAADLRNPIQPSPEANKRSDDLYRVNCLPCHGPDGRGNSTIAQYFRQAQLTPPADYASAVVRQRTDGELFFVISNGLGNMPPFGKLLTPDERWYLVNYIRRVQAQNP